MNYFCNVLYFREVVNPGVELPEHGASDGETCRRDIKLYLHISKGVFVGVMNEKLNFHQYFVRQMCCFQEKSSSTLLNCSQARIRNFKYF
jgi:hypothetical protein